MKSTWILAASVLLAACGGDGTCPRGSEGCECAPGDTCDGDLVCVGGVCTSGEADSSTDTAGDVDDEVDGSDVPVETGCAVDEDCDDGDPCTTDTCVAADGTCEHEPLDEDGDGWVGEACGGEDCDDGDPDVYPGADPDCSGTADMDCDGLIDDDEDGDGYVTDACAGGDDCDDADELAFPGSLELGCDEDRDCNGLPDRDNDGDGDDSLACGGGDCDDADDAIHSGAVEDNCNGIDDDCDGQMSLLEDEDQDGYANETCVHAGLEADCDDTDDEVFPGATEVCDGVDDDCDGSWAEAGADDDGDGVLDEACGGGDCNDTDPDVYAGAPELCPDGYDNDCDGVVECHPWQECSAEGFCRIPFAAVAAGSFQMGSPTGEPGRYDGEDLHTVTFSQGFEIMVHEVRQDLFQAVMGYNPSDWPGCGPDCPVENVTWYEAAAFTNALSERDGLPTCYTCTGSGTMVLCERDTSWTTPYDCPGYRLPTEAEWEYAARAGTTTGTYNGTSTTTDDESPNPVLDPIAWWVGNGVWPSSVGGRTPNDWGLHDILGNVWEWCHDWMEDYAGDVADPWGPELGWARIYRGGSAASIARNTRAAVRYWYGPDYHVNVLGLRVVRTLP